MKLVILGGGTAGWMTASAIAKRLGHLPIDLTLVESAAIGTVGVGEATLPHIRFFNEALGVDEREIMAATQATIKLGIEFCGWHREGSSYLHPFGDFGEDVGGVAFHHAWHRLKAEQAAKDVGSLFDYSLPVQLAAAHRFALPNADPESIASTYGYAFQFDAGLYAAYLATFAQQHGCKRVEGKVREVQRDGETGNVTALKLDDEMVVEGDFFIDCSGFRALLIGQKGEVSFRDWSAFLPCDSAFAVPCECSGPPAPFTRATARQAGWQWRIPLQHRTGNGHVFCSAATDDEAALDILMRNLDGKPSGEPRRLSFTTGHREKFWHRNVVAIGLSSGFLEPLESTSIHLIQQGILRFLDLFPWPQTFEIDRSDYNRLMTLEFERIRDFLVLHYVANQREEPFWKQLRSAPWPDSLRDKVEAFRKRGLLPDYDIGVFLPASWLAVLVGQGILPESSDPRLASVPPDDIARALSRFRNGVQEAVQSTPSHAEFLARYCPAECIG